MEVHEKRALLDAVETLIKRPALANETTLGTAIAYMKKLVEESTGGQLTIAVLENEQEKNND